MRIQTSDYKLHTDALKYAEAVLIQDNYTNSFMNYECVEDPNLESKICVTKPEYIIGTHPEFSPDLSQVQIDSLKNPDLFTKDELIRILNTFILENYELEIIEDERPNGHGIDNAKLSNSEIQERRDTHKEEEQR